VSTPASPETPASSPAARPSAASIWWHAARPNTLPAALAGVIVGLGAGYGVGAPFRPDTALGCVLVALLLQVLANFANDLSDFRRGADTAARQGPMRVAAAGLVTERQLEVAIATTIAAAGVVGLWLAAVLEQGRRAKQLKFTGAAREVARALVGSLEGAMMLARSYGEVSRFQVVADRLLAELSA